MDFNNIFYIGFLYYFKLSYENTIFTKLDQCIKCSECQKL